ncbi:MAG: DoxX family membrane protein, partial [bacterium]|nr:DoxX family membrane protein [bacterium]
MKLPGRITETGLAVTLSRLLVGGLFTFSGIVKAVDPLGTAYKIDDYLIEMGLTQWMALSLPLSLLMVVGEFVLGMLLLLGLWRKGTLRLIALFLLFFTPLTLWIALTDPVEDCG